MQSIRLSAAILLLLAGASAAWSADDPAKPTAKGEVVAYEEGKSITLEVATSAGKRKMEFTIMKDKTEIKLLGDTKVIKVGMIASVWAQKTNTGQNVATKIEAGRSANSPPGAAGGNGILPKTIK